MNHTPEALQLARELDTKAQALGCPLDRFSDALRHQHARIAELEAENKSLRILASGGIDLFERYSTFKAKCAELEAMLDAVGAGGVGESIKPQIQADTVIQVSVPTGWKLVPVEPTDDMFIEGMEADCRGRPSIDDDNHVRSIWRAMLSSAPDAPQPTENLRCKSTQKRLATLWGYEKARQPLTDAKIMELRQWHGEGASIYFDKLAFARAIEAAHGITGSQQ